MVSKLWRQSCIPIINLAFLHVKWKYIFIFAGSFYTFYLKYEFPGKEKCQQIFRWFDGELIWFFFCWDCGVKHDILKPFRKILVNFTGKWRRLVFQNYWFGWMVEMWGIFWKLYVWLSNEIICLEQMLVNPWKFPRIFQEISQFVERSPRTFKNSKLEFQIARSSWKFDYNKVMQSTSSKYDWKL